MKNKIQRWSLKDRLSAGLLWALLALLLSAEQQLGLAAQAAEQGLQACSPDEAGVLRKILAKVLLAQGAQLPGLQAWLWVWLSVLTPSAAGCLDAWLLC